MIEEDTNLFPFHTLKAFSYTSNYINKYFHVIMGFPGGSVVKNLPTTSGDAEDQGSFPESGRSPGEGAYWGRKELDMTEYARTTSLYYLNNSLHMQIHVILTITFWGWQSQYYYLHFKNENAEDWKIK